MKPPPSPTNRLSPQGSGTIERRSLDKGDVPAQLLDRYLIERDRQGRPERFYRDHRTADPAFRDHGRALSTSQAYPDTVTAMVKIAQHRGWSRIKVSGDEAFRREVWVQARSLGLEVAGHRPSERDRQAANEGPEPLARRRAVRDKEAGRPSAETVRRRLEMAAVVVRTLVADPATQARLMSQAWLRSRLGDERDKGRPHDQIIKTERRRAR